MTDDPTVTRSSAPPPEAPAAPDGPPRPHRPHHARPARGLPRLVSSLLRLADLQYQIWLTRAKLTALKIALFLGLWAAALLLALLALIFLYLGSFRLLTDHLHIPPAFAFLIFAALHLLIAAALAAAGHHILHRPDDLPPEKHPAPSTTAVAPPPPHPNRSPA